MLTDSKLISKKGGSQVLAIVIIVAVIFIIVKIYKATKAAANVTGQAVGNAFIAAQLGLEEKRVIYIRSEAERLWNEGVEGKWGWHWMRNYNEEMFTQTINEMVSATEVRLLDQLYKENSGERLKDVIDSSFSSSDKAKVNSQWLAVINS